MLLNNFISAVSTTILLFGGSILGCIVVASPAIIAYIVAEKVKQYQNELYSIIQPNTGYKNPTFVLLFHIGITYYAIKKVAYSTTIKRGKIRKNEDGFYSSEEKLNGKIVIAIPIGKKTAYKNWWRTTNIYIWHYALVRFNTH